MGKASSMARKISDERLPQLDEVESSVVELFSGMARSFGLPPSIGAIYGLLFITKEPQCLDDLVGKLDISKGSASQGLGVLRKLGAIRDAEHPGRREYFTADLELKKLVGGFLRSEVIPQLDRGAVAVSELKAAAEKQASAEHEAFLLERLGKLASWQKRGRQVLGLLHRFLD